MELDYRIFGVDLVAVVLMSVSVIVAMLVIVFIGYSKLRNLPTKFPAIGAQIVENLKNKRFKRSTKINYARLKEDVDCTSIASNYTPTHQVPNVSTNSTDKNSLDHSEVLDVVIDEIYLVNNSSLNY